MIAMTTLQWARLSDRLFDAAAVTYILAMVGYAYFLGFRKERVWLAARTVTIVGLGIHLVSIVARAMAADRVPWGNMWEYSSLLAFLVVLGYLVIVEGAYKIRTLGAFPLIFAAGTMGLARLWGFYVAPGPLVPALNSYWLKIHVLAAIIGSSLYALGGGVLTILYLFKYSSERRQAAALGDHPIPPVMGASQDLADPPHFVAGSDDPVGETSDPRRRGILPPSAVLDRMAYRTIAFGFPIWTFAVIAGALWAQEAWGRYWGWDPKETWAFITWVIFAGYLHARATSGWKGTRAAVVALVGFVSLLVTYYGVNLFLSQLHGYAK
jgi:cytochrome c-type biogenesis protein CcsB